MADATVTAKDIFQRVQLEQVSLFLAYWRGALLALAVLIAMVIVVVWRLVEPLTCLIWMGLLVTNTLAQAWICRDLERQPIRPLAIKRWMPWLIGNLVASGTLWGTMPILLAGTTSQYVVMGCLFNAMLMFCVSNAPGTERMMLAGTLPMGVLGCLALLLTGLPVAAAGYAALAMIIIFYGRRLQHAVRDGLLQRQSAVDLSLALRSQQQTMLQMERERTLLLERDRLMRDMHDGLGSSLVAALAALDRGSVQPESLAMMLRECIDELRTVIDSLEPADHDLVSLLATLRFRLERRLQSAGIQLQWDMQELPPLTWMGPSDVLNVMRFVQEVLGNAMRHADARRILVSARPAPDRRVEMLITDDGRGFELHTANVGRGLPHLQQRARALGAGLEIDSALGRGTRISLRLPVERASDQALQPVQNG